MCKPILVTMPILLLLLDWWPLQRKEPLWPRIVEKIPFFALSIVGSMVAVWSQAQARSISNEPFGLRIENAAVSYMQYLMHLFWPAKLAPFYPFPNSIPIWEAAVSAAILVTITGAIIRLANTRPYLLVGWVWFLITLAPVIGILHIGMQAWADRYSYIPYIGLSLAVSWAVGDVVQSRPRWTIPMSAALGAALACCVTVTFVQVRYWHDTKTLFQHALAVTSGNYYAHAKLGAAALREGNLDEATKHHEEELRLLPYFANSYIDIGLVYAAKGQLNRAAVAFARAVDLNPAVPSGHYNLGHAYDLLGRHEEAVVQFQKAVLLHPDEVVAQKELGSVLLKLNKPQEALPYCQAAAEVITNDAQLIFSLAYAFHATHQIEKAIEQYQRALRLNPDLMEALNGLAWIYATNPRADLRNGPEAVRLATHACELTDREQTKLLDTLAAAYAEAGRFDDAIKTTEKLRALKASHAKTDELVLRRLALYKAGKPYREE
jgi:tetratricopeptide (TPR) repeat protein